MIQARNKLSQEELSEAKTVAKTMTVPIAIPISLTCLILTQTCPPFSFIMKKANLLVY